MSNVNFTLQNKGNVQTSTSEGKEAWVPWNAQLWQNLECGVLSVSSDLMVIYDKMKYVGLVFIAEDLKLYEPTFASSPEI
jgi:hypothetical protein